MTRTGLWLLLDRIRQTIPGRRQPRIPIALPPPIEPPVSGHRRYAQWVEQYDTLTDADRTAIRAHIQRLARTPTLSVVMPAYETPEPLLRAAIASVCAQLYPHWELCIADDASPSVAVAAVLAEAAAQDPRVKWTRLDTNGHISAATNAALQLATGTFVALLDHDDLLAEHALYEVAAELDRHPDADLVWSDEDRIDLEGRRHSPYFKMGWNPDLMLGQNAFCHLGVYRRSLIERVGGLRSGLEGSQDYDLALRAAAASDPSRIRHIPAILYHWRERTDGSSFSQAQIDLCVERGRRAVSDCLAMQGVAASVGPAPRAPFWNRVQWPLPDPLPRVSFILPARDGADRLARCATGLLLWTEYPDVEVLVVDDGSVEAETHALFDRLRHDRRVRILPAPGRGNRSALYNAAASEAEGHVLVLLGGAIDVLQGDWLRELVSQALRSEIGVVGAKLQTPDRGEPDPAAEPLGGDPEVGYFGLAALVHDVGAVPSACMAVRRAVFDSVGGFDAVNLPNAFADTDFCFRVRERGLRVLWTPFAAIEQQNPPAAGGEDRLAAAYMHNRWPGGLGDDLSMNPNLSGDDRNPALAFPPRRVKPWLLPPPGPVPADEAAQAAQGRGQAP